MDWNDLKNAVFAIGFIAMIAGAFAIALTEFQESDVVTVNSTAYNITGKGLTALDNTTGMMPTAGIIAGIALIIGIVVGSLVINQNK